MTSKERQVQVNEVKELDESSAKKEQSIKKALLKENFVKAQA